MEVNERSSPFKERERADTRQSSVVREGNMPHVVVFLNAATKGLKNLQVYARKQGSQIVTGLWFWLLHKHAPDTHIYRVSQHTPDCLAPSDGRPCGYATFPIPIWDGLPWFSRYCWQQRKPHPPTKMEHSTSRSFVSLALISLRYSLTIYSIQSNYTCITSKTSLFFMLRLYYVAIIPTHS